MAQYQIPLSGLNCGKCVKKLEDTFLSHGKISIETISKDSVTLNSTSSLNEIFRVIEAVNYRAGNKVELILSGLNCGKCVAKVKAAFEANPDVISIEVTKEQLNVTGLLNEQQAISLVSDLGYDAIPADKMSQQTEIKPDNIEPATTQNQKAHKISDNPTTKVNLLIEGMTCASCVSSVEKACLSSENVTSAQINLAEQSALVEINSASSSNIKNLVSSIEEAGYKAKVLEDKENQQEELLQQNRRLQKAYKRSAISALLVGGPLMLWGLTGGNMMIRNSNDQFIWGFVGFICLLLLATAGRSFYINAWKSIMHGRATMDTLVAMGTGAAWFYSMLIVIAPDWFPQPSRHIYFEASAMIIGLISLGHYIEAKAKVRTTQSLQSLIGLQAKFATVIEHNTEKEIPIAKVQKGMTLLIKPGERFPVDGTIISGESFVDESMLTGEPVPKLKKQNDKVTAGTINADGSLQITTTGVGSETVLSRIIQLVRQAQSSKPAIAKLADSISAVFVPVVVGIAVFAAVIWYLFGPEPKVSYMLVVSTTVLIIACPCALGLATPLSVTAGVGKAAELGILIRDADVLQTAAKIDTVVFDKTGTLTLGEPNVQHLLINGDISETELLSYIYPLEKLSEHPLAKAVCRYAKNRADTTCIAEGFVNQRGKGVSGIINGKRVIVGSVEHIRQCGGHITSDMLLTADNNAWTPVAVMIDDQVAGIISVADPIKNDAKQAIERLTNKNIDVVLLTGDNHLVAQKLAEQLGIRSVISQVLPEDKANHVKSLQKNGSTVAMVGDGINDAPALAQADIGIAMGSGSDVAVESAQMTLLNSSPLAVENAIQLSKATVKNMKQNLLGAFIYNIFGIPIAAGVLYPITGFLLSPVVAGAAMAMSSITVVTNANRLRSFRIKE